MHLCTNAQSTHEIFAIKKNQPEPQFKCLSVSTEHEVQHFSDHLRCEIRKRALCLYLNRWCLDVSSASSSLPFSSDHKVEVDQACFHAKPQLVE